MKYRLVQCLPDEDGVKRGHLVASDFDEGNVLAAMEVRGFQYDGPEEVSEKSRLRTELQGQPKFSGLCGPMWGGLDEENEPIIRYEDWDAYRILST